MDPDRRAAFLTRLEPFFSRLLSEDASGQPWLPPLLAATQRGHARLGELVEQPGSLVTPLGTPTESTGRLGAFEFPVAPPRDLLAWYIDHSDELVWPPGVEGSREQVRLRRALLHDDPPGAQGKARERARELLDTRLSLTPEWWRFGPMTTVDCALITPRLVVAVVATRTEPLPLPTPWYPQRSALVRGLEAARALAADRQWASMVISEEPLPEATHEHLERVLPRSAPYLDAAGQSELQGGYLGNITWRDACAATGLALESLNGWER